MTKVGFALDLVLAIGAHVNAGNGNAFGPVVPLILLIVSYLYYKKKCKLLTIPLMAKYLS